MKTLEFEIIDHGHDGEQYFPGCEVAFSRFTDVATGIGTSAKEAAEDAMEQMPFYEFTGVDVSALEKAVAALSADDSVWAKAWEEYRNPEWHRYVSIRWRIVEAQS